MLTYNGNPCFPILICMLVDIWPAAIIVTKIWIHKIVKVWRLSNSYNKNCASFFDSAEIEWQNTFQTCHGRPAFTRFVAMNVIIMSGCSIDINWQTGSLTMSSTLILREFRLQLLEMFFPCHSWMAKALYWTLSSSSLAQHCMPFFSLMFECMKQWKLKLESQA